MGFAAGLVLMVLTVVMIIMARPADGASAPFLRVWIVGQIYALTAMVCAVLGAAIAISTWPF